MGQRRTNNPLNLPDRVYQKHGAFYFVDVNHKWHRLGDAWNREARSKWASLSTTGSMPNSVNSLLDEYLRHCASRVAAGKLSSRTLSDYRTDAEYLRLYFQGASATDVQRRHVASYLTDRCDKHGRPAPIRANREVALLSAAYGLAVRQLKLSDNPCLNVPRNEENVRERYVEHWERRQFAKRCCPPWLRAYLLLKYLTGLRMGDMLRLSPASATKRGLRVDIGKSRKRKVLEFRWTWALRTAVQVYLCIPLQPQSGAEHSTTHGGLEHDPSALLSRRSVTRSMFRSAWQRAMNKWVAMGHERFWEHDIRAKAASDSTSLANAAELLGHDNSSTTARHYRRGVQRVKPLR
jgi:integrase